MTGAKLREIRESFGLTQQQFGEVVGLKGSTCGRSIRRMEGQGPVNPLVARVAELMMEVRELRSRRSRRGKNRTL